MEALFHNQTTSNIDIQIHRDQSAIDAEIVMFELFNKSYCNLKMTIADNSYRILLAK
jgi:hypothetical protein